MAQWIEWIKIAKGEEYYLDEVTYSGACCYELGIRRWLFEEITIVYVGETCNEKKGSIVTPEMDHIYLML
jgi:hypothetical protein